MGADAIARIANGGWNGGWNGPWNGGWNGPWNGGWNGGWSGHVSIASALNSTREGINDPSDVAASGRPDRTTLVSNRQNDGRFGRWAPDVQMTLLFEEIARMFSVYAKPKERIVFVQRDKSFLKIAAPGNDEFDREIPTVLAAAELREERAAEIFAQEQALAPFFSQILPMRAALRPATTMLLETTSHVCSVVVHQVKSLHGCYRPSELSPQIQPMIEVPGHGTFPMGHAVQAFAAARVLQRLLYQIFPSKSDRTRIETQLFRLARRIAWNRVVAGVHFPVDIAPGAILGVWIADHVVNRFGDSDENASTAWRDYLDTNELSGVSLITDQADESAAFETASYSREVGQRVLAEWAHYAQPVSPPTQSRDR